MITGSFFFNIQSCEYYTTPKGEHKKTRILRKWYITFYRKQRELLHIRRCIHLVDKVSPTFRKQKNGINNATVTQWRTGTHLFPVKVWADIATRLDLYLGLLYDTPMNTVWVENHKTTIKSQMKPNH